MEKEIDYFKKQVRDNLFGVTYPLWVHHLILTGCMILGLVLLIEFIVVLGILIDLLK